MSTILLLDDDPQFRSLVVSVLEGRGHKVLQAGSGSAATELLEQHTPDLIIVDGHLPDTSGVEWISNLPTWESPKPVIFISSYWHDLKSSDFLKQLGVCLVLYKPVIPTVFGEQVDNELSKGSSDPLRGGLTAEGLDLELDQALLTLQKEYGRTLTAKVRELSIALHRTKQAPAVRIFWQEARSLAHKMRGTAGSCGFLEAGEAAGQLEDALVFLQRSGDGAGATDGKEAWRRIDQALARANAAAEAAVIALGAAIPEPTIRSEFAVQNTRVLVITKDSSLNPLLQEIARRQLLDVSLKHTPDEALASVDIRCPDVAILAADVGSSDAAFELARQLRSRRGCEELPIAFVGPADDIFYRVAAAHAGGTVYVPQPVDSTTLDAALQRLIVAKRATQPHVLIADDDKEFANSVASILYKEGMRVTFLREATTIFETLEKCLPDVLLLDVMLPGVSGFDICRMLRATPRWQELPILFLTAKTAVGNRLAAFQAGADDYLAMPIVAEELLTRIKVRLDRMRLLRERADKDSLTGLLLRRAFLEGLSIRMSEAHRHDRLLTLCLLDLDLFKQINDTYGHLVGDRVLAALGKLLGSRFRVEDLRGRWGGEEFVLAFLGERAETIEGVLSRVLEEFRRIPFVGDHGEPFHTSFSAGISCFPDDGASPEELLQVADQRLYRAKREGRCRVVRYGGTEPTNL